MQVVMCAHDVVPTAELGQELLQGPSVNRHDPIKTLLGRQKKALDAPVLPGLAERGELMANADRGERRLEQIGSETQRRCRCEPRWACRTCRWR